MKLYISQSTVTSQEDWQKGKCINARTVMFLKICDTLFLCFHLIQNDAIMKKSKKTP